MKSSIRHLPIRAVPAALALMLAIPTVRAETVRTGGEPWYWQVPADVRKRAQVLFAQAIDKHQKLLRGDALVLYEQALALWDNPDIQWNLALVLDDLSQYLRAYQVLRRALRWGDTLGPERLQQVHDRIRVLETQRLARIETSLEEPTAVVTLDGKLWPRGVERRSMLVLAGDHYLAARKSGYFPVTRPVYVKAGQQARVPLSMDEDRLIETRRWPVWNPWVVVGAGVVVAAVGAGLEWRAFADRKAAANAFTSNQRGLLDDRANVEQWLAVRALITGGVVVEVGLALAWLNQPRARRTEDRPPPRIEFTPNWVPQ